MSGALLLALPPAAYILYTFVFGVNVPFRDDWLSVPLLRDAHYGVIDFSTLLGGANGQRSLFPRLLGLAIFVWTNFNTKALMFASDGFMICAYAMLLSLLRRFTTLRPAVLAATGFLFLSFAPFDIPVWASEFSWALITFCLVSTLWLLTRSNTSTAYFIGAVLMGGVATFSGFQGAFLWPAGLLCLLLLPDVKLWRIVLWIAAAVVFAVLYFWNLSVQYGLPGRTAHMNYASMHPFGALEVFLVTLGNVFAGTDLFRTYPYGVLTGLGALFALLLLGIIVYGFVHWRKNAIVAISAYFSAYALIFSASIAVGRGWGGMDYATNPRYTLYGTVALAVVFAAIMALTQAGSLTASASRVLATALAAFQIGSSAYFGITSGVIFKQMLEMVTVVARNYQTAPDPDAFFMYWDVHTMRTMWAPEADRLRLSVYNEPPSRYAPACPLGAEKDADRAAAALTTAARIAGRPLAAHGPGLSSFAPADLKWSIAAARNDRNVAHCILPYADVYEAEYAEKASALHATGTKLPWPVKRPASSTEMRAWRLLRNVYEIRPELAAMYPEQLPGFSAELARWAAFAGSSQRYGAISQVLAPFSAEFKAIYDAATAASSRSSANVLGERFPAGWSDTAGFALVPSLHRWFAVTWGSGAPERYYSWSRTIAVTPGGFYVVSGTIDARYSEGAEPCFYLAERSGLGIGMTCATRRAVGTYRTLIQVPADVDNVHWVATTDGVIAPHGRITAFSDANFRPASQAELRPTFAGTPQSLWYLPPEYAFLRVGEALEIAGTGQPTGKLYAHSTDIPARPDARFQLRVRIDATDARGRPPCFYVAELPDGRALSMICARNGAASSYAIRGAVPAGVKWLQLVAFSNDTTIASGRAVVFSGPRLIFTR